MTQMRAALYDEYGPPDVLYLGSVPVPQIAADEVLVRVQATTVNGGELLMRAGRLRLVTGRRFPRQLGIDFVGEVAAAGAAITFLHVGDRVWGAVDERRGLGAAAEYVAVTAQNVSLAPTNLTPTEAVSILAGGTTALTGLRDKAHLRPGEQLLVRGASGGVGSVAVQIGSLLGAHVTALANSKSTDFLHSLGAETVLDYATTTPVDLGTFDVIFDTHCTELRSYRRHLAPGGRMVAIAFDINRLPSSISYIAASTMLGSRRVRFFRGKPNREMFALLTQYAERGTIRPVVEDVFPLHDITDAHAALEAGGVLGKIVVQVAQG